MVEVSVPRSAVTPPVLDQAGFTVLTLPETPATDLPVRVLVGGQTVGQQDFTRDGNIIQIEGDYSHLHCEVDYYLLKIINIEAQTEQPDLPEIELYSIRTNTYQQADNNTGAYDLLLGMVDDSEYDLIYNGTDLSTDKALQSAITLSVYTDAWVNGQKGWWGDSYNDDRPIADSKLWTLMGKPTTPENINLGNRYIQAATQWLIDDEHVDEIEITTEHHANELDWLAFRLQCKKDKQETTFTIPLR